MALNPEWHRCPIFEKIINDGLCWEVCFADRGIQKEGIPELMEIVEKHKLIVKELQDKFCEHCKYCQWKDNTEEQSLYK